MNQDELATVRSVKGGGGDGSRSGAFGIGKGGFSVAAALAWLIVGLPILWGVWKTVTKALALLT